MTGPQRSHILQSHPKLFLLLLLYFHSLKKTDAKLDTFMESCKTLYFHSSFSYLPYLIPPAVRQIGQGYHSHFKKEALETPCHQVSQDESVEILAVFMRQVQLSIQRGLPPATFTRAPVSPTTLSPLCLSHLNYFTFYYF